MPERLDRTRRPLQTVQGLLKKKAISSLAPIAVRTQDSQTESLGAMDLRDDADAGRGKVFRYLISFAASGYGSWTHDIAEDDRPGRW